MSTQSQDTDVTIFDAMLGKTFKRVEIVGSIPAFVAEFPDYLGGWEHQYTLKREIELRDVGSELLAFVSEDGENIHLFYHIQDCCESVELQDVTGDLTDLVGYPLLQAELVSESGEESKYGDTSTWSFYKFATRKGSVTLRWLGSSNGYYSETVDHNHFIRK